MIDFTPVFVVTLQDVIGLTLIGVIAIVIIALGLKTWIKQTLCKHDGGVGENMACEATCRKCGKNLGFIGSYKERYGIK
jgi:hypothetical protein